MEKRDFLWSKKANLSGKLNNLLYIRRGPTTKNWGGRNCPCRLYRVEGKDSPSFFFVSLFQNISQFVFEIFFLTENHEKFKYPWMHLCCLAKWEKEVTKINKYSLKLAHKYHNVITKMSGIFIVQIMMVLELNWHEWKLFIKEPHFSKQPHYK